MPFQSEKQRRYLHANHPEIAKRWEREYANGGISNHFRKKLSEGSEDSYGQLLDDWDAGLIIDALPGEDFTTYYNRIMKVENDTGTEEVESVNLLAENQDPLNLSEGVTTLFQAKDGGRIGLYQGGGPHGGGADSGSKNGKSGNGGNKSPGHPSNQQTSTSTSSPSSDRQPGFETSNTKTTTTSPKGDDDAREKYISTRKYPKRYKTVETHVPHTDKKVTTQIRDYYDPKGHQKRAPKNEKERHILDKIAWGIALYTGIAPILGMKVPGVVTTAGKLLGYRKNINTALDYAQKVGLLDEKYTVNELFDKEIEKAKTRKSKMDEYESLPKGHPDRVALEIELQIGKKPDNLGDDGGTSPISVPVATEEVAKATDEGAIDMFDAWGEIKRKQALNASLQAKWAAEKEAKDQSFILANSGGLANLFRVKNNQ